ncbi:hypothetical protein [Streptomyces sp. NBC_01643]|uniref:hypothetical protein n=1 Tax=Streptomyces sp. NBC_01643 TaxID=2975906 RepID=UPI00386A79A5|nr:hypothetical protein OHB03_46325 [Streptomyces sp. NBC_01643]WTD39919.1 hypothetical protein OHB03_49825 [Streptomyces sp. NBC_01643]
MKHLSCVALSAVVLCLTASAVPVAAPGPKDADAATVAATATAGLGMAYECDPKTGRYFLLGFASPEGKVVPFAKGQRGYIGDPHTGKLTPLIAGQMLSSPVAKGGAQPDVSEGRRESRRIDGNAWQLTVPGT